MYTVYYDLCNSPLIFSHWIYYPFSHSCLCFILRPIEFNQFLLCDHWFGVIHWILLYISVGTWLKIMNASPQESISGKWLSRDE